MGKLVLYFPDGSTRDIFLVKERTTIGRRADNDVPLATAAVSAEHAAVVTVLDDSFLEDLGSTNGTFVNDKPVTKHFLRDRDRIDVGREILVYYTDAAAAPDVLPPDVFHHDTANLLAPLDAHLAALEDLTKGRGRKGSADGTSPRPVVAEFDPQSIGPMTGQVATEFDSLTQVRPNSETTQRMPVEVGEPIPPRFVVHVVDGPSAGREISLDKDETLVGRVGVEVVALRRRRGDVEFRSLESAGPESGEGAPPVSGRSIHAGETFTVAGITLRLERGSAN